MSGGAEAVARHVGVAAAPEQVWAVLADLGAIAEWAPGVDHSCLLTHGPAGPGTARRVQVGRLALVERVTTWEPPSRLAYRVEGLPPIVGAVTNEWHVEADGPATTVTLTTAVDAGARPPGPLVARIAVRRLAKASAGLLDGLAAACSRSEATR